jgi:hypothetical protein
MPASKSDQRFATRCLEEARKASDLKQKGFFIDMAHEWQKLAEREGVADLSRINASNSEPNRRD